MKKLFALQKRNGSLVRIAEFWDLENGLYQFDGILIDEDKDNLINIAKEMVSVAVQSKTSVNQPSLKVVEVSIKAKQPTTEEKRLRTWLKKH